MNDPILPGRDRMTYYIGRVGRGVKLAKPLTEEEAFDAMKLVLTREASEYQIGAFLAALRMKGEAADEVAGFTRAARQLSPRITSSVRPLLDFGDPYDGKAKSPNLSIAVAAVLSAAGCSVMMHGDENIPTKKGAGAGLVLQALGGDIGLGVAEISRCLDEQGIAYLHASSVLPFFGPLKTDRLDYGLRSSLNVIEKMWNLAGASFVCIGIYHAPYFESSTDALLRLGQDGYVVQGNEGFAEFKLTRPTRYVEVKAGSKTEGAADPAALGLTDADFPAFEKPVSPADHAEWNLRALENRDVLLRKWVVFNAGIKLSWVRQMDGHESVLRASEALDSGAARKKLTSWIELTRSLGHAQRVNQA